MSQFLKILLIVDGKQDNIKKTFQVNLNNLQEVTDYIKSNFPMCLNPQITVSEFVYLNMSSSEYIQYLEKLNNRV